MPRIELPPTQIVPEAAKSPSVQEPTRVLKPKEPLNATPKEKDASLAGFATVLQKGNEYLDGKDKKEIDADEVKSEIHGFAFIARQALVPADQFQPLSLRNGRALLLKRNGENDYALASGDEKTNGGTLQVTEIRGRDGDYFICEVGGKEEKVAVDVILAEHLLLIHDLAFPQGHPENDRTDIFTESQEKAIKAYSSSLRGDKNPAENLTPEELKETITYGRLISADAVSSFAKRKKATAKDMRGKDDAEKEKAATEYNATIDGMLERFLKDRQIADPTAVSEVVNFFLKDEIDAYLGSIEQHILELEKKAGEIGNSPGEYDEALKNWEDLKKKYTSMKETLNDDGVTLEFFQGVQLNTYSSEDVKAVEDSLYSGKSEPLIEVLSKKKFLTEKEKEETKNFLERNGGTFTIGGLLLALLMMKKASENGRGGGPQGG